MDDTGDWNNQQVMFVNQLYNMIELAQIIAGGAVRRDECRGAHWKPEFFLEQPEDVNPDDFKVWDRVQKGTGSEDDKAFAEKLAPAHNEYFKAFKENNDKWLKSTIAEYTPDGPEFSYEDVDTHLCPVKPRKYD
jgi:succinate dehydrogenase / fumarate reductase flavoprotein subunit